MPVDFDERYLRVVRVEDNFLSGTVLMDNEDDVPGSQPEEGYVIIASNFGGIRRIAAAGEEFHAARVFVDVLASAGEVTETRLSFRSVGGVAPDPFFIVRHLEGDHAEKVEGSSEIGAVQIGDGVLAIRPGFETQLGDANFDGSFDISDPIGVLGYLFLGDPAPLCLRAADYGGDGQVDISDPIHMLSTLFLGQGGTTAGEPVSCR